MELSTPLNNVPRIGPIYQKRLKGLGIATVRDLLFHFPRAYEDLTNITPVSEIKGGETVCAKGSLTNIQEQRTYKKRMSVITAILQDSSGAIKVTWFNQPYLMDSLQDGQEVYATGKPARNKDGVYLANPSIESPKDDLLHMGRIVPVYQETAGVSSKWIRSIIFQILQNIPTGETLPESIIENNFLSFNEALQEVHFPSSLDKAGQAKRRFSFEELFTLLLFVLSERKKIASVKSPTVEFSADHMKRFTAKLPFSLTDEQRKAAWYILKDMERPRPMNRLLQGDVGSGKTVVATMAALSAVKQGYQVAFMAPTEILAQQHFKTVSELLAPFRIKIALLTGKTDRWTSPKLPREPIEISRKKLLEKVKDGEMQVVVGTHSLIQDKVRFSDLALIILDEQHRFGIQQRAKLITAKDRRTSPLIPHLLSMTATPIPRTLALTVYGDLDLTLIKELPPGRKEIETRILPPSERQKAYDHIREHVKEGRQAFVICPRIEEGEAINGSEVRSAKAEYEKLSNDVFSDLRVGLLHGKMGQKEKEEVMRKFKMNRIDILVATSVVEVGVDIPNATVMMIEGAERFGLAQLHQFRGRIGRGEHASTCYLLSESPAALKGPRLKAVQANSSGFKLAERDLNLRGPGQILGSRQWGIPDLAMEQLSKTDLVEEARKKANEVLEKDRTLKDHPMLSKRLEEMRERLHLE